MKGWSECVAEYFSENFVAGQAAGGLDFVKVHAVALKCFLDVF